MRLTKGLKLATFWPTFRLSSGDWNVPVKIAIDPYHRIINNISDNVQPAKHKHVKHVKFSFNLKNSLINELILASSDLFIYNQILKWSLWKGVWNSDSESLEPKVNNINYIIWQNCIIQK